MSSKKILTTISYIYIKDPNITVLVCNHFILCCLLLLKLCMCMHMCMHYTHAWRGKGNFVELVLSFRFYVGSRESKSGDKICISWQEVLCPLSHHAASHVGCRAEGLLSLIVINL